MLFLREVLTTLETCSHLPSSVIFVLHLLHADLRALGHGADRQMNVNTARIIKKKLAV